MEAPNMGVGMVGVEFQPNPLRVEIRSNDMATHEILVAKESLLEMEDVNQTALHENNG
jgi:hypothetical protein